MSKRKKIVLTSLLLSLGLVLVQTQPLVYRYWGIGALFAVSYLLSGWALSEGLKKIEWLTVLILPAFFTAGVGLFYFLLPETWLARLPIFVFYAIGIYILLLTENIFSIAAIRNIQLLRAAQATGFLLTLITSFFLFDSVFSFRLNPWFNGLIIFGTSFFLFYQGLWDCVLGENFSGRIFLLALVLALVLGEVALAISFWPLTVSTGSLFLITILYILLGLSQSDLQERLFAKTVREYLWVGGLVFLTIFLTARWGG